MGKKGKKPEKNAKKAKKTARKENGVASINKIMCPSCKEKFEVDKNLYDEGDTLPCPECDTTLIIKVKAGKLSAKLETEKYDEEFDEEYYYGDEAELD